MSATAPTGDAGASGAQAAILEDVPKVMEEYAGKKIAFYCTNCGLQIALQQAVLAAGENAYYPLPCCPSPFHGYQEAFGLETTYGDIQGTITNLANFLHQTNSEGRFSSWEVPVNMAMINASYEYACMWAEGKLDAKIDEEVLTQCFSTAAGCEATLGKYTNADGSVCENYYLIAFESIDFADYVTE